MQYDLKKTQNDQTEKQNDKKHTKYDHLDTKRNILRDAKLPKRDRVWPPGGKIASFCKHTTSLCTKWSKTDTECGHKETLLSIKMLRGEMSTKRSKRDTRTQNTGKWSYGEAKRCLSESVALMKEGPIMFESKYFFNILKCICPICFPRLCWRWWTRSRRSQASPEWCTIWPPNPPAPQSGNKTRQDTHTHTQHTMHKHIYKYQRGLGNFSPFLSFLPPSLPSPPPSLPSSSLQHSHGRQSVLWRAHMQRRHHSPLVLRFFGDRDWLMLVIDNILSFLIHVHLCISSVWL